MKKSSTRLRIPSWPAFLLVTNQDASGPGAVIHAGVLAKKNDGPPTMRIFGQYALVYLLKGRGFFHQADRPAQQVRAGDLMWLFPEVAHAYGPQPGDDWVELYLVFNGPIFDLLRSQGVLSPQNPVWPARPILPWLNRLKQVIPKHCPAQPWEATAAAFRLLEASILLHGTLKESLPKSEISPSWLKEACALLNEIPRLELSEVARRMGFSYESFRKQFSLQMGYSPGKYQLLCRVEQASHLIRENRQPLKEIAEATGFADEFHFAKRFKQITGMAPGAFRAHTLSISPNRK